MRISIFSSLSSATRMFRPAQSNGCAGSARRFRARLLRRLQRKRHRKAAAFAQLAFHRDRTRHLLHQIFDDGHAQPRAHAGMRAERRFPRVGFKQMLQKFGRHTNAGVLHHDFVPAGRLPSNCRASSRTLAPGLEYLNALDKRLLTTWPIFASSPSTQSARKSRRTSKRLSAFAARGRKSSAVFCSICRKSKGSSCKSVLPASARESSKISLINDSNCLPAKQFCPDAPAPFRSLPPRIPAAPDRNSREWR